MNEPISKLRVIGIRYLGGRHVSGNEIPLSEYKKAGIYDIGKVPYTITEPSLHQDEMDQDQVINIGRLGGKIAREVAIARRAGEAILMTGGNCCHITGILGGLQDAHGPEVRIGLVWFDAHGDFNTRKTTRSGMLGGMPVAVAAGLTHPKWRELSHIVSPIPTERILLVGARNLDPAEETLIRATESKIAAPASQYQGEDLKKCLDKLAKRVDLIYLHIDADILDESYTPNHRTKEPGGPDMDQIRKAIQMVMSTGKVAVFAVVSVSGVGDGAEITIESGKELIQFGLESWGMFGMA